MKIRVIAFAAIAMCLLSCLGLWLSEKESAQQERLKVRVEELSKSLLHEKMQNKLLQARFDDFKQEVALYIPADKLLAKNTEMRDLASVIPHRGRPGVLDDVLSRKNLKIALEMHEEKKYSESTDKLLALVSEYPDSPASVEASYYLVKNFFLTSNKQEALVWADKMLTQFPDSVWTAKALIISADIYKEQGRKNDVIEIYHLLINTFDSKEIRDDIKARMADVGS